MIDELLTRIVEYPKRSVVLAIFAVAILGSVAWWHFVWQDPQRVFEDMLARDLSTTSVTKTVSAGDGSQGVDQTVRLEMGSANAADWLVTARQNGATVTTESIGTPSAGYVRYVRIATSQKTASKQSYDFHTVTGVWAKADGKTDQSLSTLFSQSLLDIASAPTPPIADLPGDQRAKLLQFMASEQVFAPDYSKTKTETLDGHLVYTYQVAVRMEPYVRLMQGFAHDFGLASVDGIDPSQYAALAPLTVSMSVDPSSHQLMRVAYAGSGFTEDYADWGLHTAVTIPRQTITSSELQRRLQAVSASS